MMIALRIPTPLMPSLLHLAAGIGRARVNAAKLPRFRDGRNRWPMDAGPGVL